MASFPPQGTFLPDVYTMEVLEGALRESFGGSGRSITAQDILLQGANPFFYASGDMGEGKNVDDLWTPEGLERPAPGGYVMIYSRRGFRYPIIGGYLRWPTLVDNAGAWAFFGLENAAASVVGLVAFQHRVVGVTDRLELRVGSRDIEITPLAPADWQTANHYYFIRIFRGGAEFWIDGTLVGVAISELGLANITQTGAYAFLVDELPDGNYGVAPTLAAFIGIEAGVGAYTFPVSRENFTIVDGDPDYHRLYKVLEVSSLAASGTTALADCMPIPLSQSLSLTVEDTYDVLARLGAKLQIYTSYDGETYDTEPVETRKLNSVVGGETRRETFEPIVDARRARFIKATIENLDADCVISDLKIMATLV